MAAYKPPLVACPIAASCDAAEAESRRLCRDPYGCQQSSRESHHHPKVPTNQRVSGAPNLPGCQSGAHTGRAAV